MNIIHKRTPAETFIDSAFNVSQKMVNYENSFFISKLWTTIGETDKTKMLFMFYIVVLVLRVSTTYLISLEIH